MARIMEALIQDLGGREVMTAAQSLLLDNIKAKIIVLLQISKWVDQQPSVITATGELLPCLGRGFTAYSEALRRDLEALTAMASKKHSRLPTIEDLIKANEKH